jgi:hypothetical protein
MLTYHRTDDDGDDNNTLMLKTTTEVIIVVIIITINKDKGTKIIFHVTYFFCNVTSFNMTKLYCIFRRNYCTLFQDR